MRVIIIRKSTLIRITVFCLILIGAIAYTSVVIDQDVQTFYEQGANLMVCSADTQQKVVALTFDTTFGEDKTEQILEVLKEKKVKATFAVIGKWALQNPELMSAIAQQGHEIINHSMNHERYTDITTDAVLKDANEAKKTLQEILSTDTVFIRPPYAAINEEALKVLVDNGYVPIRFSVDARDWELDDAEKVTTGVLGNISPGAIVVFQNNTQSGVDALEKIIDELKERDYQCVTLSDLVVKENYTVDANGVQKVLES